MCISMGRWSNCSEVRYIFRSLPPVQRKKKLIHDIMPTGQYSSSRGHAANQLWRRHAGVHLSGCRRHTVGGGTGGAIRGVEKGYISALSLWRWLLANWLILFFLWCIVQTLPTLPEEVNPPSPSPSSLSTNTSGQFKHFDQFDICQCQCQNEKKPLSTSTGNTAAVTSDRKKHHEREGGRGRGRGRFFAVLFLQVCFPWHTHTFSIFLLCFAFLFCYYLDNIQTSH